MQTSTELRFFAVYPGRTDRLWGVRETDSPAELTISDLMDVAARLARGYDADAIRAEVLVHGSWFHLFTVGGAR